MTDETAAMIAKYVLPQVVDAVVWINAMAARASPECRDLIQRGVLSKRQAVVATLAHRLRDLTRHRGGATELVDWPIVAGVLLSHMEDSEECLRERAAQTAALARGGVCH